MYKHFRNLIFAGIALVAVALLPAHAASQVQRNDTLFATILRWPSDASFTFKSLGTGSEYGCGKVRKVELLGYGKVKASQNAEGLTVEVPSTHPNEIAPVFCITFKHKKKK